MTEYAALQANEELFYFKLETMCTDDHLTTFDVVEISPNVYESDVTKAGPGGYSLLTVSENQTVVNIDLLTGDKVSQNYEASSISENSLSEAFAIASGLKISLIYKSAVMSKYTTEKQIEKIWFGLDSTIEAGDGQFTVATATAHSSSLYAINLYKLNGLTLYPYQLNAFLVSQSAELTFREGTFTFISSEKLHVF